MNYYVIGDQGQKYGPADVVTLGVWAQQGRLTPSSILEDAQTGQRYNAAQIPGIQFGGSPFQNATQGGPYQQSPGYQQPTGNQQPGYQQAPSYHQYPRGQFGLSDDGSADVKNAWICGVAGLVCCPLVSAYGIYLASNAQRKGNTGANAPMYFCIATLVLGGCCGAVFSIPFAN
jgi:hypothetical protein